MNEQKHYETKFLADEGNAAAVIAMVRDHVRPTTIQLESDEEGGERIVAVPTGLRLESLKRFEDERRTHPERRAGTAELTTIQSFADHVKRFADDHSAIFAVDDRNAPELIAVLDYHEKTADGQPRFGHHRSRYRFPLSDEWKAWNAINGKTIDQAALAAHLEDHLDDVIDPAAVGETVETFAKRHGIALAGAARLQELARGLQVRVDRRVANIQNPSTGEARVYFEETHTDDVGGELKVPGGFALGIPVFRGGDLYQVPARLRYRVSKGAILWSIALHRTDRVFDHAFDGACSLVEEDTGLPVFHGRPEA